MNMIQSRVVAAGLLAAFGRSIPLPATTGRKFCTIRPLTSDERAFRKRVQKRRAKKGYA